MFGNRKRRVAVGRRVHKKCQTEKIDQKEPVLNKTTLQYSIRRAIHKENKPHMFVRSTIQLKNIRNNRTVPLYIHNEITTNRITFNLHQPLDHSLKLRNGWWSPLISINGFSIQSTISPKSIFHNNIISLFISFQLGVYIYIVYYVCIYLCIQTTDSFPFVLSNFIWFRSL